MAVAYLFFGSFAGLISTLSALMMGTPLGRALALYPVIGVTLVLGLALFVFIQPQPAKAPARR